MNQGNHTIVGCIVLITILLVLSIAEASSLYRGPKSPSVFLQRKGSYRIGHLLSKLRRNTINSKVLGTSLVSLRGGQIEEKNNDDENKTNSNDDEQNDEERYSRQLFTLGARAHSLVRISTIIIDGPTGSGLLYEAVKNLALSGVGKIIILTNNDDESETSNNCLFDVKKEQRYFNNEMDDLGIMYRRGAQAECFPNIDESEKVDELELILEYIKRLNPSVKIKSEKRTKFIELIKQLGQKDVESVDTKNDRFEDVIGENPVFLSVDRPQSTQIVLNDFCRKCSLPFVSIDTAGCYGRAFCDFGNNFHVVDEDGEAPQTTLLSKVEVSNLNDERKAGDIMVHCVEGEHHDVSKGDTFEFHWKNGVDGLVQKTSWVVVFVQNPICFTAKLIIEEGGADISLEQLMNEINEHAHSFSRVKVPKKLNFLSLSQALEHIDDPKENLVAASDLDKSFDTNRRAAIMNSFEALDKFVEFHGRLPNPLNEENASDCKIFWNLIEPALAAEKIVNNFALCCKAKFVPLQAIYGALGAQEVLKAVSGLYNPIRQFLIYDCDEILDVEHDERTDISSNSKAQAKGMKYILGKKVARKLASEKIFVVGSGAIGCELLKNLAAMDAATQKKKGGSIILTDMDTIEKSNLSRQFLFRDADVGKFKSAAAAEAMQRLNPRVQMDTHTAKVGEDSISKDTIFNDRFWLDGMNIVMNALDNVEARLFIDSQCVANRKAMIDAGTLGAKGNVQVVVPCQSESYGSSVDPPEPTIAVCTLKNFPYQISHTIQWGRDLFDGLFSRRPSQVNENFELLSSSSVDEFSRSLLQKLGEEAAVETATELSEDLIVFDSEARFERIKEASIQWAVALSRRLFYSSIQDLLQQHPVDSVDEDGEQFWTGTRRAPSPLQYFDGDLISDEDKKLNDNLIDFVRFAARLRIETYLSNSGNNSAKVSIEEARLALQDQKFADAAIESEQMLLPRVTKILELPKAAAQSFTGNLNVASFEKDDEDNGHVAFVTAASNLRAIVYGIPPVDQMETRRIAGKIVPAMISTTALVSALACIELIKLLQDSPLRSFRNAFVNLALPFFAFTAPLPAAEVPGLNGKFHTIWDRIIIKESEKSKSKGGISLRHFIRQIKKSTSSENVEVANISFGNYMLFANFLHEDDESVLEKPVIELLTEAILSKYDDFGLDDNEFQNIDTDKLSEVQQNEVQALQRRLFLDFSVIVEDSETGEEAELPPVRLKFFSSKD